MTGPPAGPESKAAPPAKRANPDGIPVRQHNGELVAHIDPGFANRLIAAGAAEAFRRGPRRYLRLRRGIVVPRNEHGWSVIEMLRKWHGDRKAAEYVAHKDRRSESVRYRKPSPVPERLLVRRDK